MSVTHPSAVRPPQQVPPRAEPRPRPFRALWTRVLWIRAVWVRALLIPAGLAVVAGALLLWWPLGIVAGLALGIATVLRMGRIQASAAERVPVDDELAALLTGAPSRPAVTVAAAQVVAEPAAEPEPAEGRVRADLDRLKADLGDSYPDFARAARLVVSTQYASAARLQRDLQLPYSRARRLLADLETEHFVGPATGTLPRQVLLPKEQLPEVERLFAGV